MEQKALIFVVDDDASIVIALHRLLKSFGFSVQGFESAEKLFQELSQKQPDCLLIDIQLPGMNGIEILHLLAESGITIPAISITAFHDDQLRDQALKAGAVDFLLKPFEDYQLFNAIQGALKVDEHKS